MQLDNEKLNSMDPYIFLSMLNMKLRDEFSSLEDYCRYYDIVKDDISNKLKLVGYAYNENVNQFIAI